MSETLRHAGNCVRTVVALTGVGLIHPGCYVVRKPSRCGKDRAELPPTDQSASDAVIEQLPARAEWQAIKR